MAKSRATLLEELNASVRSSGQGGLTTAQDLRTFLTSLIDEIVDHTNSTNAVLEFVFQAQFTDVIDRTIGVNQASEYQTQQLQNVADVIYQVNEEMVKLPFTTSVGDILRISIKRSNSELGAVVILRNE